MVTGPGLGSRENTGIRKCQIFVDYFKLQSKLRIVFHHVIVDWIQVVHDSVKVQFFCMLKIMKLLEHP
jgi:hypothetical protein